MAVICKRTLENKPFGDAIQAVAKRLKMFLWWTGSTSMKYVFSQYSIVKSICALPIVRYFMVYLCIYLKNCFLNNVLNWINKYWTNWLCIRYIELFLKGKTI